MFTFFPCRSKQYALYMELHLVTTTNNIFGILHFKTVVKSTRFMIFWYYGNNPNVKVQGVEALKCQIKLLGV